MKFTNRHGVLVVAMMAIAIGATLFSAGLAAQEEGWQITRADYGFKNQRNEVTDIVKDLIGRGGVNGRVAVNNQTMGGDPAIGKGKSLHILARNRRNEEREFNYNEGGFVEVRVFNVRRDDRDDRPANYSGRDHDDRDDHAANYGNRDHDEWNGLTIIRGYYGVQGRTLNVTDVLQNRIRDGMLSFVVTNSALGGDPAIGAGKTLIVVYRHQGKESATAVREGNTLTIP
ncbi:MAG: hypothetical protein DMG56_07420 [Acidobacteria bacterium]|nr:MAG: hypothetical protein DMG54_12880 [Acidobacteriota bacterium]PYU61803.1 MAG: hypothetical protein DMG55_06450 [Acidobacteriota bacterium]PYU64129.1 MAG: hypothetical protein DMG56_07420 [Acidobacteriota bacterium]PYU72552.1 MAG: hypothetical protein DMG52_18170 [Acidobacteriota bacterium]